MNEKSTIIIKISYKEKRLILIEFNKINRFYNPLQTNLILYHIIRYIYCY